MAKFRIVVPPEHWGNPNEAGLENINNAIFLAGPCPRKNYEEDWRYEAYRILEELDFDGVVISPTNSNYMNGLKTYGPEQALRFQTNWERIAMHTASALVFWIARDEKFPALTTNIEFGEWYKKDGVFIGWPNGAIKTEYIALKMEEQGMTPVNDLRTLLANAVDSLKRPGTVYFTSDTHFGQERTLQLSRRPFKNVMEMDLTMMSNWNKVIRNTDVVIHAGDFMDSADIDTLAFYLDNLNFKQLDWVLGNYDRKVEDELVQFAQDYNTKHPNHTVIIHSGPFHVQIGEKKFVVVHEPNDIQFEKADDELVLFGHIHGRAFAKRDGFDLGIDYSHYKPLSLTDVEWLCNAMQYWDENVYSERCNTVPGNPSLTYIK